MSEGTAERGGEGGTLRVERRVMMKREREREGEMHAAWRALTEAMCDRH